MLIVTDRPETYLRTWIDLIHPYPAHVAHISDRSNLPPKPDVILCDVDLSDMEQVAAARGLIALSRANDIDAVFLVGPNFHRDEIQAYAAGATRIVRRDSVRAQSLPKIILALLEKRASNSHGARAAAVEVSSLKAALGGMFEAARIGSSLDLQGLLDTSEGIVEAASEQGVRSLLEVIWQYDNITYQHCLLVTGLAAAFAVKLGFSSSDRRHLTRAAIIHDIGKAFVPLEILNKPGRLNDDEFAVMKAHTTRGYELLRKQGGSSSDELAVVRSHHEYLDGTGYPDALANGQVPDVVRLITITDICAALIERRAYKEPMTLPQAYELMNGMHGRLDPDLLRAFRAVIS